MKASSRQAPISQHRVPSQTRNYDRRVLVRRLATGHARRRFLHLAAGVAALPAVSAAGWTQTYPSRPITIIIAYPPGGSTDVIGRILGEHMRPLLGQPVVIENIGGANGSIGAGRVARAAPDGYALIIGNWNNFVANGALYALPYNLYSDFKPIALLSETPLLVTAKKALPANNLNEFIAWLRVNPNKASQGHAGIGSVGHVGGVLFQKTTGTHFQFIPYRGGAPAVQDLVAGNIDFVMNSATDSLPQVHAGTVKAFAVMAKRRLSALPEIPTTDEAGLPGFYFSQWFGLWAPKDTPDRVIAQLKTAVVNGLANPAVSLRIAEVGQELFSPDQQTPEALAALHRAEIEKWWPIIKAANIKGE
jgi:tripartite-type tricarboxylate transporter receptor subunit TctC